MQKPPRDKILAAEAQLYDRQKAANAELYMKKTLLTALGGNYNALRDYLMIKNEMFKDIAKISVEQSMDCSPRSVSVVLSNQWTAAQDQCVWTSGGGEVAADGGVSGGAAMKEVVSVYRALPPLFQTVHEQTVAGIGDDIGERKEEDYVWLTEIRTPYDLYMRLGRYTSPFFASEYMPNLG